MRNADEDTDGGTGRTAADRETVEAVMAAARVLVGLSARSVAAVDDVVTLPQLRVLMMVASRERVNLAAVATALGVHPSNGTRIVDRLVQAGLLHRGDDPADRRNLVLELTADGGDLVERITAHRRAAIVQILDDMPAGRRTEIGPVLHAFAAAGGEVSADDAVWSMGWTSTS